MLKRSGPILVSSTLLVLLYTNFHSSHSAPTNEIILPEIPPSENSIKIIDGVPAAPNEFPYLVSIQNRGLYACVGTLVTPSIVVTTAFCVDAVLARYLTVVAGAYYMREALNGIQQLRTVKTVSLHPWYTNRKHDIAILELTTPFANNSSSVAVLPLARRNQESSGLCYIAGWGWTQYGSGGPYSEELRKGQISINRKEDCERAYPNAFDRNYQLCSGAMMRNETVYPCVGDSGGPLVCNNADGSRYFAGVVAYGLECGRPDYPFVSMEIAKERDWLDSKIQESIGTTTISTTTKKSPQISSK